MGSYIDKAVQSGKKANMIYLAKSGAITKRVIQILSITDEKIVAYCFIRNQIRTFKRPNILAMELLEYNLEAMHNESTRPWNDEMGIAHVTRTR